jgi:hypothetical protein
VRKILEIKHVLNLEMNQSFELKLVVCQHDMPVILGNQVGDRISQAHKPPDESPLVHIRMDAKTQMEGQLGCSDQRHTES